MSVGPFDWDEAKRAANAAKHGVDFADIARFDWSRAIIEADRRFDYGEVRRVAFGPIGGRLHAAVVVIRGERVRLISLRRANAREVKAYERNFR